MYRILLILVTVIVLALAVGYSLKSSHKTSNAVTALLPRDTVAFVHVPDFERTRDDWHRSDIYQLYKKAVGQVYSINPHRPQARLAHANDSRFGAVGDEGCFPSGHFDRKRSPQNRRRIRFMDLRRTRKRW